MNKNNFLMKSNSLRMQARTKRENIGLTQQQLAQLLNEKYGTDYDHRVIARFETLVREDQPENANKNINLELLYLIYSELELKIDNILFPKESNALFSQGFFDKEESEQRYKKDLGVYKKFIAENYNNNKSESISNNYLYQNLRNSVIKSFLPPQISFISSYASGSTSLISLFMGTELSTGVIANGSTDVYYIHKDFKPLFYPEDKNSFTFNKTNFNLGIIFDINEPKPEDKEKVLVHFIDAPILKYCTILDTKDVMGNLSLGLLKESRHNIIVSNFNVLTNEFIKIIVKLNKEFGYNSDSYVMANDYLNDFSILFSHKSNLTKREDEAIKGVITNLVKTDEIVRINLKETLNKTILSNIYSYDLANPESYNNIRNEFEKIINKTKKMNDCFDLDVIPVVKELSRIKACDYNSVMQYYENSLSYLKDLKQITYENNEQDFSSRVKYKIDDFIKNELNEEFFKKLDYIKYKEDTRCIIISKEFLEKLENDINKQISDFVSSIIDEQSCFKDYCLENKFIIEKYWNYEQYCNGVCNIIFGLLHNNSKTERFVDEYISDVANSNKPTAKYFIKRFTEFKNKEGNTLNKKIFIYITTLLDSVFKTFEEEGIRYSKLLKDTTPGELDKYISLYETIQREYQKSENEQFINSIIIKEN